MPATVLAYIYNGSGPTSGSAEGGITMGRDDNVVSTTVLPIPTSTGTKFSYAKTLGIQVTGGTLTDHITNRRVLLASSEPAGLHLWWETEASYSQAVAPAAADAGINYAVPGGYSGGSGVGGEVTTTPSLWDNTSVITSVGPNGAYVLIALGCDSGFAGGGGSASLPNLLIEYDEGP
jgi:hypothetical protein